MFLFFSRKSSFTKNAVAPYPRRDLGMRMDSCAVIQEVNQKYR
jgi:hypothetical protein